MFHISFVYLGITIYTLYAKFPKKYACLRSCCWCKIWLKWPICPNKQQGPLLEISYISLPSVTTTLHYHRQYQISSSLEANSSLEDMKQLCECVDGSHLNTGNIRTPKLIIKPDFF